MLKSHFTGNAAGDITTIVMDGIPIQVRYSISAASHQGFTHSPRVWANLPIMPIIPLRYLADIVTKKGCDPDGVISILYAKAEIIRTNEKVRQHPQDSSIFLNAKTAKRYLSNGKHRYHHSLNSKLETPTQNQDYFVAATNLISYSKPKKPWTSQPLQRTSEHLHRYWEPPT